MHMEKWLQFTLSTIIGVFVLKVQKSYRGGTPLAPCGESTSESLWPHNALVVLCEGILSGQPPSLEVGPGAGNIGC